MTGISFDLGEQTAFRRREMQLPGDIHTIQKNELKVEFGTVAI